MFKAKNRWHLASLMAGASMLAVPQVHAQDTRAADAGVGKNSDFNSGDIIVTARKREERLVDVPIAITAFSDKALARYATASIEGLATQVPQVQITRQGAGTGATVTIRGIGSNASSDDAIEQSVAFNIDGVPTSRGRVIMQSLFDLENVQILKGPQALYFGKNSPAGVIVLNTKGPGDHLEGYVRAGYEFNADEYTLEGALGGPITDTLGIRVAGIRSKMNKGYVKNIFEVGDVAPIAYDQQNGITQAPRDFTWGPGTDQWAVRTTLKWEPTSDFSVTLKGLETSTKDNGDASQTVILGCPAGTTAPFTADISTGNPLAPNVIFNNTITCDGRNREISQSGKPAVFTDALPSVFNRKVHLVKVRGHLYSLQMNYDMDDVTLTSISGYYKYKAIINNDGDYNGTNLVGGFATEFSESFTQELRASSSFDGPLNFTGGFFYGHDDRTYHFAPYFVRYIDPATGIGVSTIGRAGGKGDTYSAFLELTYKPSEKFELSGGARATIENKTGYATTTYLQPGLATVLGLAAPAGTYRSAKIDESNVSPQVTASWHPQPDMTVFVGYRTGYKAGTISSPTPLGLQVTDENIALRAEDAEGFEGGFKGELFNRRLMFDITAYYYDFKNLQTQSFDSAVNATISKNAGNARTKGVDASMTFHASEMLTLRSAVGYNDAKYTDFPNGTCYSGQPSVPIASVGSPPPTGVCVVLDPLNPRTKIQNLTGASLPRAPKWVVTLGGDLDIPLSGDLGMTLTVDALYNDGYFTSETNAPQTYQDSYTVINASVRLHDSAKGWDLALIGRNLTDKLYIDFSGDRFFAGDGAFRGAFGAPRTIMLQGTYNF